MGHITDSGYPTSLDIVFFPFSVFETPIEIPYLVFGKSLFIKYFKVILCCHRLYVIVYNNIDKITDIFK